MAEPNTAHELKLLKAVNNGLIHKTRLLLSLHSIQVNDERYFDYHLLIKAIDNSQTKLARLLIEKGFRVYKNSKSNKERTVLHAVIQSEDLELLGRLLARGASPDILNFDEQDKTPFHLAIDNDYTHIIDIFLTYFDAKTFDKNFLLHYAIKNNHVDVVAQLISRGFSLNNKFEKNVTPFCVALMNGMYETVKLLVSNYGTKDIKISCHDDIAPAYIASLCGDLKLIERYIECGLHINSPLKLSSETWSCFEDCSGYALLHFAVKNVQLKMTEFLLSAGADIFAQNENGSSPLLLAFETKEIGIWQDWQDFCNNNSIIDLLLEANTKFNSNTVNKNGLSHFHVACCRDKPAVVEHFLKLGALLNEPVGSNCHLYKKFSPLHFAAKFRCKKTVKLLLENGADVEQKDFQNMTALHIAAKESCLNVVDSLLQYGADATSVDSLGNTPLHLAFENKNYKIVDRLLSVPNLAKSNSTNIKGVSHFHIACTRNNVNIVKSFIEESKKIVDTCIPAKFGEHSNSKTADWSNYSPLHLAVSHNRAKIVHLLLRSGANVGLKNERGCTPFHLACEYTFEMFEEFIESVLCDLSKHKKNVIRVNQPLSDVTEIGKISKKFMGCVEKIDWSLHRQSYLKILNLLLDFGSDVNCIDNEGHAPLFHVYTSIDRVESILKSNLTCSHALSTQIVEISSKELQERRKLVISSLLELGANIDKCYSNRSILHFGVSNYYQDDKKSYEILELFLKKGAYVDAEYELEDGTTWTPLTRAVSECKCSIVDLLLKYNASVDYIIDPKNKLTPLLLASKMTLAIKIFASLIDKSKNVNARLSDGSAALHNLALTSMKLGSKVDTAILRLSIAGVDFNIQDSRGRTALHLACESYSYHFMKGLLYNWADINIEDNDGRSVCCCLRNFRTAELSHIDKLPVVDLLQSHIIKLRVIGLPCSVKTSLSILNCIDELFEDRIIYNDDKTVLQAKCEAEVRTLRETEIHGNCSLYDVINKDENTLSHLVKNPAFDAIVKSETFEKKFDNYGSLVSLKYRTGLNREKLLPRAKCVLDDLAGLHLPDSCSENIYKYFTNVELTELTETLGVIFESKMKNSDCIQLRNPMVTKRQKS